MDTRNEEQVVYLKDLIFAALYQWRKILAVAIALALLLGGFKAYKALSAPRSEVDPVAMERYEEEKKFLTDSIADLKKSVAYQEDYLSDSMLMKLDPYSFYEAKTTIYIDTGYQILPSQAYQSPDKTGAVVNAYATILTGSAIDQIAKAAALDSFYLRELFFVEQGAKTLTICVRYADEAGAVQLMNLLNEQVLANQESIGQTVCLHELTVLSNCAIEVKSLELASQQKAEADRLAALKEELKEAQKALDALYPPQAVTVSMGSVVKSAVIFAVIGGVLGVFLTVCAVWVVHITGSKVYSPRVLRNRTGVKVLGCLPTSAAKNPIDRSLRKLEGRNAAEPAQQAALLAVNIANLCSDANALLVIGAAADGREALVSAIAAEMPSAKVLDMDDLLLNPDAMKALKTADAVLLVEQCNVSRYDDVAYAAATVADHGKKLIGCVVVGG